MEKNKHRDEVDSYSERMKMNTFVTRIPATDVCAVIDRRRCDYTKATQKCNIFVRERRTWYIYTYYL